MNDTPAEPDFGAALVTHLGSLRAFARTLVTDASRADDLVQETVMKAWAARANFAQGTNLRAWLFTILRNTFYSEFRKRRREVEDPDGALVARLAQRPGQDQAMAMRDFQTALAKLGPEQREAIILVGAAGFTYEEAAAVCGCAVGTVKSRVNRARQTLLTLLGEGTWIDMTSDRRMEAAMGGAITPGVM